MSTSWPFRRRVWKTREEGVSLFRSRWSRTPNADSLHRSGSSTIDDPYVACSTSLNIHCFGPEHGVLRFVSFHEVNPTPSSLVWCPRNITLSRDPFLPASALKVFFGGNIVACGWVRGWVDRWNGALGFNAGERELDELLAGSLSIVAVAWQQVHRSNTHAYP